MTQEKIIVLWKDSKGQEFCNLFEKKDLQKRINELRRDYPHGYQRDIDVIYDIIVGASSVHFATDTKEPMLEFYLQDGNSAKKYFDDYMIEFFASIMENNENKILIPEKYSFSYMNKGKTYVKEISRKDVRDIFGKYVEADALNNGISKKIVAINNYAKELFINFDNAVEINSLYYKTYFEEIETAGIPIPYIHRIMWSCIKKLCDLEES